MNAKRTALSCMIILFLIIISNMAAAAQFAIALGANAAYVVSSEPYWGSSSHFLLQLKDSNGNYLPGSNYAAAATKGNMLYIVDRSPAGDAILKIFQLSSSTNMLNVQGTLIQQLTLKRSGKGISSKVSAIEVDPLGGIHIVDSSPTSPHYAYISQTGQSSWILNSVADLEPKPDPDPLNYSFTGLSDVISTGSGSQVLITHMGNVTIGRDTYPNFSFVTNASGGVPGASIKLDNHAYKPIAAAIHEPASSSSWAYILNEYDVDPITQNVLNYGTISVFNTNLLSQNGNSINLPAGMRPMDICAYTIGSTKYIGVLGLIGANAVAYQIEIDANGIPIMDPFTGNNPQQPFSLGITSDRLRWGVGKNGVLWVSTNSSQLVALNATASGLRLLANGNISLPASVNYVTYVEEVVPEPSSFAAMAIFAAGSLAAFIRNRKQK